LERGFSIRALVRKADKLKDYKDQITIVSGDATDAAALKQLLYDIHGELLVDVVISTIGSPNNNVLVVQETAEAMVTVLQSHKEMPRIVWMTSTGINEATGQAEMYPCCGEPNRCCFGYGLFGWLQFQVLIPCAIGQALWDDMGHSETVIRNHDTIYAKTVIVRPTNMTPVSETPVFSDEWRKEGGDNLEYVLVGADDPPPGKWICRKAIAAALLDLATDSSKDGTAVSLFQKNNK